MSFKKNLSTYLSLVIIAVIMIIILIAIFQEDEKPEPVKPVVKPIVKPKVEPKAEPKVEPKVEEKKEVPILTVKEEPKVEIKPKTDIKEDDIVEIKKSLCELLAVESSRIKLIRCSNKIDVFRFVYNTRDGEFENINNHFWKLKYEDALRNMVIYCSFYNKGRKTVSYTFNGKRRYFVEEITVW